MPPVISKVDCVINLNGMKVACQFPKLGLILGELIEQKKGINNKVVNLTWPVAVLVILLLDTI